MKITNKQANGKWEVEDFPFPTSPEELKTWIEDGKASWKGIYGLVRKEFPVAIRPSYNPQKESPEQAAYRILKGESLRENKEVLKQIVVEKYGLSEDIVSTMSVKQLKALADKD